MEPNTTKTEICCVFLGWRGLLLIQTRMILFPFSAVSSTLSPQECPTFVLQGGWFGGSRRPRPQWPAEGRAVPVPGGAGGPAEGQRRGQCSACDVSRVPPHHQTHSAHHFSLLLGDPHFAKQKSRLPSDGACQGRGHPQTTGRNGEIWSDRSLLESSCSFTPALFCRRRKCVIPS